jgi:hypothetical protein
MYCQSGSTSSHTLSASVYNKPIKVAIGTKENNNNIGQN